jgi:hypothetical protein
LLKNKPLTCHQGLLHFLNAINSRHNLNKVEHNVKKKQPIIAGNESPIIPKTDARDQILLREAFCLDASASSNQTHAARRSYVILKIRRPRLLIEFNFAPLSAASAQPLQMADSSLPIFRGVNGSLPVKAI